MNRFEELEERFRRKKNLLPFAGRVLVASTFLEDAFRLLWNFKLTVNYFAKLLIGYHFAAVVIAALGITEAVASFFIISKKKTVSASYACILACVLQAIIMIVSVMGIPDGFCSWFLSKLSIVAGLLLLIAKEKMDKGEKQMGIIGHFGPDFGTEIAYFQLVSRVLISALFLYKIATEFVQTTVGIVLALVMFALTVLLAVGFKTRACGAMLSLSSCVSSLWTNDFWNSSGSLAIVKQSHFFEDLAVSGGLLLIVSLGPGNLSVDEKIKSH
eukprot:TRINITY_DN6253_c0_g1::TRINITY_DN6253_c0_g1_i1::g.125::m.125 TRINITY_DN6253_c0_g1::TRINITY_DN6253_c0_g1_i1::g.125  ORF type:complete len:271 (-),score=52.73,sp/O45731/YFC7_CAEEL/28.52/3e-23,SURF4/PF02077.10/2.7e-40,DoxX/PF07681.7/0.14,DoxX/PF07681.7/3.3e+03,DoxX/PF07681.7/30,HR_lesion/PF05514.6/3.5,HR_lesion/PF05514.6/1.7e+03,HR_lesion/PF05514.6/35 TRINITY_DN6253_c0_g1_i1:92-904(-)